MPSVTKILFIIGCSLIGIRSVAADESMSCRFLFEDRLDITLVRNKSEIQLRSSTDKELCHFEVKESSEYQVGKREHVRLEAFASKCNLPGSKSFASIIALYGNFSLRERKFIKRTASVTLGLKPRTYNCQFIKPSKLRRGSL